MYFKILGQRQAKNMPPRCARGFIQRFPREHNRRAAGNGRSLALQGPDCFQPKWSPPGLTRRATGVSLSPAPIMARSLPWANGLIMESERPCFFPAERCSLGADGLAVRVSRRFPRMRSRPQECTCCAGYSAVKVHTQGQGDFTNGLLYLS